MTTALVIPANLMGLGLTHTVFLKDGRVQIDKNLVGNTIRPCATGKKNWLFMGDAQSGLRAATFYTLIGNSHREGIDATAYLTDTFNRLPTDTNQSVHRLTPEAWAAGQTAKRQALAQAVVAPMQQGFCVLPYVGQILMLNRGQGGLAATRRQPPRTCPRGNGRRRSHLLQRRRCRQ